MIEEFSETGRCEILGLHNLRNTMPAMEYRHLTSSLQELCADLVNTLYLWTDKPHSIKITIHEMRERESMSDNSKVEDIVVPAAAAPVIQSVVSSAAGQSLMSKIFGLFGLVSYIKSFFSSSSSSSTSGGNNAASSVEQVVQQIKSAINTSQPTPPAS